MAISLAPKSKTNQRPHSNKALIVAYLQSVYQDFQEASNGDPKLTLHVFNGKSNENVFYGLVNTG